MDYMNDSEDVPAAVKDMLENLEDTLDKVKNNTFDLAAFLDEIEPGISEQAGEYIYLDKIVPCLKNLFNRFEDEEWLKTNLGMKISTNGNTVVYSFTPKLDKLAEAIVVEFKPAIINEEDYNELLDELHDSFNGYSDEEFKFNVTMTITDGIFTGLRAEFEADGQNLYMEYSISKINATTFDTEALTLLKGNAHMLEMDELFGSSVEDEAVSNRVDVMA